MQSSVAIIGFVRSDFKVVCFSENCESILGLSSDKILGLDVKEVLTNRKLVHGIRGALSLPSIESQRERVGRFPIHKNGTDQFDAALSIGGELAVLELEPASGDLNQANSSMFLIRTMLASLNSGEGIDALLDAGVNALRQLTGFDRVMGYRFLPCGAGEVVAERHSPSVASYLGLRYPAYDIPTQVRTLMIKQPFRMIGDVDDPHSLIKSKHHEPVDMSMTFSRGVSPIYIEYLNNMGVKATMNISIIVRGELWGMFAFHHYRPRRLSPDKRLVCELFGQLFSMQIQQELEKEILLRRKRALSVRKSLSESNKATLEQTFEMMWSDLAETVNAHGLAIVRNESVRSFGDVPSDAAIRQFAESSSEPIFSSDSISAMLDNGKEADNGKTAGAMAVSISESDNTFAVFFRNEAISEVRWAGEPSKEIEYGPNGPRLTPRRSFQEYVETTRDKSIPWSQSDLSAASELQSVILDVIYRDANASNESWRKQKNYQDVLIAELNHRVKNILALVRSIARQTKDSSHSLENSSNSFEKRIGALATAHDLVGGSGLQWARLEDLVHSELKPFGNNPAKSIDVSGPPFGLRADVAPVIALVVHELVSNANKHGALSDAASDKDVGLEVKWYQDAGGLTIEWNETGTGPLKTPAERGFGLTLIETAVPFEYKGKAVISFGTDGLKVKLWIPSDSVRNLDASSSAPSTEPPPSSPIWDI